METHFLFLPLFVPIAEFDHADQSVGYGMSVRTEMLRDGKTRRTLANASAMFTKTFPQSAPSLADVNRDLKIPRRDEPGRLPEVNLLNRACAEEL